MTRFRALLNPKDPAGGYVLPHAVVLVLLVAISLFVGFGAGWFARGTTFNAAYYREKYPAVLPIVRSNYRVAIPKHVGALPDKATINHAWLPAVGDQGSTGACAAWSSTYYVLSYDWRKAHPGSYLRFSPRYTYDAFSDTYSGGQDGGSWPAQDVAITATQGVPRFNAFPYGQNTLGLPSYGIDNPIPQFARTAAALFTFPTTDAPLTYGDNGGQGLVDAIHQQIANGQPVSIAIPVYPQFDNAAFNPYITVPSAGQSSRGGHEVTVIGYKPGWVRIRNQWATDWGQHGDAWLSDDFVRQYVFGADVITIGAPKAQKGPAYAPNHGPTFHAPPPTGKKVGVDRYGRVHGVVTRDTHIDISAMINWAGWRYHIHPAALAALIGTESNVNQYAPRQVWGTCDISYSLVQINVCTAKSLGVGDGSISYVNAKFVEAFFNVPQHSINKAAQLWKSFMNYRGVVPPEAYALYNGGPGTPCCPWIPQVQTNLANYYSWYNYAYRNW